MDLELMINSFPKLLNASVITLKLLSLSLFFGSIYWATFCSNENEQKFYS